MKKRRENERNLVVMCVVSFDVLAHVNCLGSVLKCGCVNKHHDYAVFSCGYVNRHRPTIIEGIYERCVILLTDYLSSLTIFAGFARAFLDVKLQSRL